MSDANLTSLFFDEEASFNVATSTGNKYKEIRWTGDSLSPQKGTIESGEIRNERDLREIVKVSESSDGGFNCELVGGDYSPLMEAALEGTFATSTDSHTGTWDSGAQTLTLTSGTFSAAFQLAKIIKVANAATAGHDGVHRIVSITSTVITFKAGTVTSSDASDAVDLTYNYVSNANTERSFLIEKKYQSTASDFYMSFSGFTINEFNLTADPNSTVNVAFNGIGARVNKGSATTGDGSPTAATTNTIIDSSSGVEEVLVAGTASTITNKFEFTTSNNVRPQEIVGSLYAKGHGMGRFLVNGQVDLYFENSTELEAFIDHTSRSLQFVLVDSAGNKFSFYMPAVKYTAGNAPTDAVDSDIIAPLAFSAINGGTSENYALQIDYVTA